MPDVNPFPALPHAASRWLQHLANSRHADLWLFTASFLETIIVPIPIELVLIPYMLLHQDKIWRIATVVTAGCLTAALFGYGVGYFLFESLGRWVIDTFQYGAQFAEFQQFFHEHGFLAILAIGLIPIPFQVAMLVAGAAHYPLSLFVLAAVIARSIRYYGLAALVLLLGDRVLILWQTQLNRRGKIVLGVLILIGVLWWLWP